MPLLAIGGLALIAFFAYKCYFWRYTESGARRIREIELGLRAQEAQRSSTSSGRANSGPIIQAG